MPPTSTSLGLRPIPGPEPVPLPDYTFWLWLIPLILIASLLWWWKRPQRKSPPTPLEALQKALEESPVDASQFATVDHLLRDYLAWRTDPLWLTTASEELLPCWQSLLQPSAMEASTGSVNDYYQWYLSLDSCRFGYDVLNVEQLAAYFNQIKQLIGEVEGVHEKQVNGTTLTPT
jgi:hypothetical protein